MSEERIDQQVLISAIRELAIELGHTPTRNEFESKIRGGRYQIGKLFGNYTALVIAADLEPKENSRIKITNDIFKRDIHNHLEVYREREVERFASQVKAPFPHLAIISDIHWPFENPRVIERFLRYNSDHKPESVIIAGDAWDMYSHAKFPRSHNLFTPIDEERLSRQRNEEFWTEVRRGNPNASCFQLLGNHDIRAAKRTLEAAPTMEHWTERILNALFTFEGVKTVFDPREELMFPNDIMIHHGYRSKLGDHRDFALYNAIVGHTHRPGVTWRKIRGGQLFELNCGLAGDPSAKGLSYTSQKITDWVNAFGVVDADGPRNIVV